MTLTLSQDKEMHLRGHKGSEIMITIYSPSRFDSERVPFLTGQHDNGIDTNDRYWNNNPHLQTEPKVTHIRGIFGTIDGYVDDDGKHPTHIILEGKSHPIQQGPNGEYVERIDLLRKTRPGIEECSTLWYIGNKGAFASLPTNIKPINLLSYMM